SMATERRADVTWNGSLLEGSGTIRSTTTNTIGEQPITWAARSEDHPGGKTSPEELIAAAHAACFSMAFSNGLANAGTPPDELQTRMSDPSVYNDRREAADGGRRLKEREGPYKLAQDWRSAQADLEAARADADLKELVPELEERTVGLESELRLALVPTDPAD